MICCFTLSEAETVTNEETNEQNGRIGNGTAFENVYEKLFQSSNQGISFIASIKRNCVTAGAFVRDKKTFEDSLDCFGSRFSLTL